MKYRVSILSEAEQDIDNAYIWYELKKIGLGYSFYTVIEKAIHYISINPFSCEEIYKGVRRCIVIKLLYGVYYKVNFDFKEIQILGLMHFKRSPTPLKKRI